MPEWSAKPFHRSLDALARLAMRETGGCGYAYFEEDGERGTRTRMAGGGSCEPGDDRGQTAAILQYPLRENRAAVAFAFHAEEDAAAARPRLDSIADAIRLLWETQAQADVYAGLANRLVSLELELIDAKISDRARGLLTDHAAADPAEAIVRHIRAVLRPSQARRILLEALSNLEEEVEERRLVSQAKRILQRSRGISEEQAHAELRIASRKSRKQLKDVALQVIDGLALLKGKTA